MAGISVAIPAGRAAVTISDTNVTNVGATTFTVVWKTSELSTPGLEVFSDSAGANAITSGLGLEYYPIAEGDPAVVNDSAARSGRRALELLAINRQVVAVRVTGLSPGTSYFVRPRTFGLNGTDNGGQVMPLMPVTTAQFTSMVQDGRLVRVRFPAFAAEGMVAVFQGPSGTAPLSAIVGDSTAVDSVVFPLANLLDTTSGTNALFATPQQIAVKIFGVGAPAGSSLHTINFGSTFNVAKYELIDASLSSPSPFIGTQPGNQTAAVGGTATFTFAATGTPAPDLKWQRKPAGSTVWTDVIVGPTYSGVTTGTLLVSNITLDMSGDQFRAIASNGVPPDATSAAVTLTVTTVPVAPSFSMQPQPATITAGVSATFTVAATGTPAPTFKWQRKPAGNDTWGDLVNDAVYFGVTTSSLTVNGAVLAMSGDQFRCIAFNGILPDATSAVATLTVSPVLVAPAFTTQPQPTTVTAGNNATFTAAASGTPTPNLKWQRKPASTATWADLVIGPGYAGISGSTLTVNSVTLAMSGDQFRAIASNGVNPDATSDAATLTVTGTVKAPATVALSNLQQAYNGSPRPVSVATTPAGLTTIVTYDGAINPPIVPGSYAVLAQIDDPSYTGSGTGTLVVSSTVLVRHAPTIAGTVQAAVQVLLPESITLGGLISNDLLVPGTPNVQVDPAAASKFGGTRDGPGDAAPTTHLVTLNPTAVLRYLMRRVNPVAMPTVAAPPAPIGTRTVTLTAAGQSAGDFATLRNLTLSGTAGSVAVPPGTYGNLTANGNGVLVLGVAGATEPAVYNLQGLSINLLIGSARLLVVGPVIITVANGPSFVGDSGAADHPEWLTLRIASGNMSLNGTIIFHGSVVAPNSTINLNGRSVLKGNVIADRLNVTLNAELDQAPPR